MGEVISTKLIWYDVEEKKPKIDEQVLIRMECYYEDDLKGKGFRIGVWDRTPHGYESWFYLGNVEDSANKMGYVWKATYWAYLPDVIFIDNFNKICNRWEILDL